MRDGTVITGLDGAADKSMYNVLFSIHISDVPPRTTNALKHHHRASRERARVQNVPLTCSVIQYKRGNTVHNNNINENASAFIEKKEALYRTKRHPGRGNPVLC